MTSLIITGVLVVAVLGLLVWVLKNQQRQGRNEQRAKQTTKELENVSKAKDARVKHDTDSDESKRVRNKYKRK